MKLSVHTAGLVRLPALSIAVAEAVRRRSDRSTRLSSLRAVGDPAPAGEVFDAERGSSPSAS